MQNPFSNVTNAADLCICFNQAHGNANLSTSEAPQDPSVKKLQSLFIQQTQITKFQQYLPLGEMPGGVASTTLRPFKVSLRMGWKA